MILFSERFHVRLLLCIVVLAAMQSIVVAHHPDRQNQPVYPRMDVIGPVGNHLPMSYRRRYNRPTNLGGKIAYHVAPTSLEAMAWHQAKHRSAYQCNRPRIGLHYFYPKPWEVLPIGPRPKENGTYHADR